ncbi:MAG: hypothetical protein ABIS67_05520 [Candidatus Eisenbacteria bacterium]
MTSLASPTTTVLRLTGRDVLDLLHRISTQSLTDLAAGECRATLFCDFRARLLHRAFAARLPDDSVWLLRDDAPGEALAAHVEKHVFREDVKVEDCGARLAVVGRLAAELAQGQVVVRDGAPSRVGIAPGAGLEVVPASSAPLSPAEAHAWELARIDAGRPRHGHEIADAFHPYEVGLADDVHLTKGCYTGQEVLQRLITYDSVRRRLARVGGLGSVPVVPVPACVAEERVGTLTSAVGLPSGEWTGLAVLAKAALNSGAAVRVEDGEVMREVAAFAETQPRGRTDVTRRAT